MKKYISPVFPNKWTNSSEITSLLYKNGWALIQYRIERDNFMVRYEDTTYWLELYGLEYSKGQEILKHCIETPLGVKAIPFKVVENYLNKIDTK